MRKLVERLKKNHFWWYQGPMVLWALALFTQSSIPGTQIPELELLSHDKIIHCLIYVVFGFTVHRAIRYQSRFPFLAEHQYLFTMLIVAVYGATDELHQYFVPTRSCSIFDWLADCLGAVLYLSFFWLKSRLKPARASL